jgi:hypothetical protein
MSRRLFRRLAPTISACINPTCRNTTLTDPAGSSCTHGWRCRACEPCRRCNAPTSVPVERRRLRSSASAAPGNGSAAPHADASPAAAGAAEAPAAHDTETR